MNCLINCRVFLWAETAAGPAGRDGEGGSCVSAFPAFCLSLGRPQYHLCFARLRIEAQLLMKTGKFHDGTPLNFDRKMQQAREVQTHKQSHNLIEAPSLLII
jgi:hypothetical protein